MNDEYIKTTLHNNMKLFITIMKYLWAVVIKALTHYNRKQIKKMRYLLT